MTNRSNFDLTVLRLPKGGSKRASTAVAMGFGSSNYVSGEEWTTSKIDDEDRDDLIENLTVERVEATSDQRETLSNEEGTLLAVDTIFFNRPASMYHPANTSDGTQTELQSSGDADVAWGLEAIGLKQNPFYSGDGVTLAILDTGIDEEYEHHQAFAGHNIDPKNFTSTNEGDWKDEDGHGTHCAGTIFGNPVNDTPIGVAPGVKKVLIGKVLGKNGGSTESIYKGLLWAALNRADIISMSLAIDFDRIHSRHLSKGRSKKEATSLTLKSYRENFQLFDHLAQLFATGGSKVEHPLVVVATGNESSRPDYTIEAAPPAVAEWFMSVNAVDEKGVVADFSNTGGKISAPGVRILSSAIGGSLRLDSGTSMAAPHVAGAAALWIERLGGDRPINPKELMRHMIESSRPTADSSTVDYGAGLVQVPSR